MVGKCSNQIECLKGFGAYRWVCKGSRTYPRRAVATIAGMGGAAGAIGGILIAQATGRALELTGSYVPIIIYAGLGYIIAFVVIQILVPKMTLAPVRRVS